MTAIRVSLRVGKIEQKGKRTHGHGQECCDWEVGGYKGNKW